MQRSLLVGLLVGIDNISFLLLPSFGGAPFLSLDDDGCGGGDVDRGDAELTDKISPDCFLPGFLSFVCFLLGFLSSASFIVILELIDGLLGGKSEFVLVLVDGSFGNCTASGNE